MRWATKALAAFRPSSWSLPAHRSTENEVNLYPVGDQMDARGWQVNRLQHPDGLHAMVTARHLDVIDQYLADLQEAVATVKANPRLADTGSAATYGLLAHVPLRGMVRQRVLDMFAGMYRAGGGDLDLNADDIGGKLPLAERLARWYVKRKTR